MTPDPLTAVRNARFVIDRWLQRVRKNPDPSSHAHEAGATIGSVLAQAGLALNEASPALKASVEWQREVAAYREVLLELRARLANLEITMRIRRSHLSARRNRMHAARRWSDLVKQLG